MKKADKKPEKRHIPPIIGVDDPAALPAEFLQENRDLCVPREPELPEPRPDFYHTLP